MKNDLFEVASEGRLVPLLEHDDAVGILSSFPYRACPECDGSGSVIIATMLIGPDCVRLVMDICGVCRGTGDQHYVSMN